VPALAQITSTPPNSRAVSATSRCTEAQSPTSQAMPRAVPPAAVISPIAASRSASLRAASITLPPRAAKLRAMPRPMPREAPVTMMLLP
jgi:hypothetical protein